MNKFLKGWRTIGVNALALGLAVGHAYGVEVPVLAPVIAHANPTVLAVGLPIVNMVLRSVTDTKVGAKQ